MLAGEPERRAARDEHDQPGRRAQQLADQRRGGVDDLEVVEQQQRAARPGTPARRAAGGSSRCVLSPSTPAIASGTSSRIGQVREVDEVDAVGERLGELVPGLEREPRLADAAGPGERHQPRAAAQQLRQLGELGRAPDERRLGRRQAPPRAQLGRLDGERRVLPQDRLLQLLQRRARLERRARRASPGAPAGTTSSAAACRPPGTARASAARRAARGRVLGDERLELGDELAVPRRARGRPRSGPRARPAAAPPAAPPRPARTPRTARPRRPARATAPAPREGSRRRFGVPSRQLRPAARRQLLEPLEIELAGLPAQPVPGPLARDPLRPQPLAQRVHLDLQRVRRRRRRPLAPQRVDQPVARHDLAAGDQQAGRAARPADRMPARPRPDPATTCTGPSTRKSIRAPPGFPPSPDAVIL